MARVDFERIKMQKHYYRNRLRVASAILNVSFCLSGVMIVALYFLWIARPEPSYFASNAAGAGLFVQLNPMGEPNSSPNALLKPDPKEEIQLKSLDEKPAAGQGE